MAELGELVVKLAADVSGLSKGFSQASGMAGGLGNAIKTGLGVGAGFAAVQVGLEGIKGAFDQVGSAISTNAQFETFRTQLGVLEGGADKAQAKLEELAKFGATTPFELPEIVKAEKVLLGFGLTGEKALKMTGESSQGLRTVIGDIASGTGASFEEIALNFGRFSSGATGEAISRFQEMGIVTREQLADMGIQFSKSGELMSPLPEALTAITKITKGKFGGMMDQMSLTFEGQMSNLSDTMNMAKMKIMAPIFDVLKDSLVEVNKVLSSEEFQAGLTQIANILATVVKGGIDLAKGAFEGLKQVWEGLQPTIATLTLMAGALVLAFSGENDFATALGQMFGPAGEIIGTVIDQVGGLINALLNLFGGGQVEDAMLQIATILTQVFGPEITSVIVGFLQQLTAGGDSLQETVMGLIPVLFPLVGVFQTLAAAFQEGQLDAGLAGFATAFASLGDLVQGSVIPALTTLAPIFINQLIPAFLSLASEVQTTLLPFLANVAGIIAGTVVPILAQLVGLIIDLVVPAVAEMAQAFESWVADILPLIQPALSNVQAVIMAVMGAVSAFWSEHWDTISAVVGSVWAIIKGQIEGSLTLIGGIIKAALQLLGGDWEGAWKTIQETVVKAFDQMSSGIREAMSTLGQLIRDGLAGVAAWAGEKALEIGNAIWQGLKRGIEAGVGAIGEAARGLAQGAFSALEGVIRPGSPSKEATELAETIPEAFVRVFGNSKTEIARAATGMSTTFMGAIRLWVESTISSGDPLNDWLTSIPDQFKGVARELADALLRLPETEIGVRMDIWGRNLMGSILAGFDPTKGDTLFEDFSWSAEQQAKKDAGQYGLFGAEELLRTVFGKAADLNMMTPAELYRGVLDMVAATGNQLLGAAATEAVAAFGSESSQDELMAEFAKAGGWGQEMRDLFADIADPLASVAATVGGADRADGEAGAIASMCASQEHQARQEQVAADRQRELLEGILAAVRDPWLVMPGDALMAEVDRQSLRRSFG